MRTTKNISITMPVAMAKDAARLAKRENRTMSELFREALRHYQRRPAHRTDEEEEAWVAQIIADAKKNSSTREELIAEDRRARRAERKYARPDLTDEDIVRIIHEHRARRNA